MAKIFKNIIKIIKNNFLQSGHSSFFMSIKRSMILKIVACFGTLLTNLHRASQLMTNCLVKPSRIIINPVSILNCSSSTYY